MLIVGLMRLPFDDVAGGNRIDSEPAPATSLALGEILVERKRAAVGVAHRDQRADVVQEEYCRPYRMALAVHADAALKQQRPGQAEVYWRELLDVSPCDAAALQGLLICPL